MALRTSYVALVLDTGPLYALLDRDDGDHLACRRLVDQTDETLIIPEPVLVELDQLVAARMHPRVFVAFLDDIGADSYQVEPLEPADLRRVRYLVDRYADSNIGFVDASVLAVVERLNEPKLATLDHRHFRMLRPRHVDALELLPS